MKTGQLVRVNEKSYYRIDKVLEDRIICFPYGGGFQCAISTENNIRIVDSIELKYKEGYAHLEGVEQLYSCICDPYDRWNGWAKPLLLKDKLLELAKELDLSIVRQSDDEIVFDTEYNDDEEEGYLISNRFKNTEFFTTADWGYMWSYISPKEFLDSIRSRAEEQENEFISEGIGLVDEITFVHESTCIRNPFKDESCCNEVDPFSYYGSNFTHSDWFKRD